MARCMASDAIGEFPSHDQQVAVCLSEYHRHQPHQGKAVKILDEDQGLIGGFGIPFGGPVLDGRDLEGEYFDKSTDFHFDWFPEEGRPLLYEHGTDPNLRLEPVGRQVYKSVDDSLGVWVTAQLNMANRYAKAIMELAKKGVLGFSSGALAGYVRRQANGKIIDWPWIEQTLTPRPANPYGLIAPEAVKHFQMAGIDIPAAFKAVWDTTYIDDLPDSAFLYIEPGGEKDADGKTTPRSLRHFPYKDADGAVDEPHLRNALSRIPQSNLSQDVKDRVIAKAQAIASEHGIGEGKTGDFAAALSTVKQLTLGRSTLAAIGTLLDGIEDATKALGQLLGTESGDGAVVGVNQAALKAGRVMSAANLDRMHNAIKAMGDMHDALCPGGEECSLNAKSIKTSSVLAEFEALLNKTGGGSQ
jgi:hypothetical protein